MTPPESTAGGPAGTAATAATAGSTGTTAAPGSAGTTATTATAGSTGTTAAPGAAASSAPGEPPPAGEPARAAARQRSLRERNLALVLREITGSDQPPSRAGIAASTGLTRATVSTLVDELIAGGLVTEVGPAPRTGAGRPALGLTVSPAGPAGLGLEINVDYLAACLLDLTGRVRHREVDRVDLRDVPPERAVARLARLAAGAVAAARRDGLPLAGTAVAVPGLVGPSGLVRLAPNLGWRDVDLPRLLAGAVAEPLTVDNEANLAALGELRSAHPTPDSFLYVSGEIGIGAGIVLDGKLFRGARGWSGELGHVTIRPDGAVCRCGAHGCLEVYAGQEALLGGAGLGERPLGSDAAAARLTTLASAGDPEARRALASAASALGVAVAGVINLLDVPTVVLGGVYAALVEWLRPAIEAQLSARVLTAQWTPVAVRACRLGRDAAVVGAAGSVTRVVLDQPARWLAAVT